MLLFNANLHAHWPARLCFWLGLLAVGCSRETAAPPAAPQADGVRVQILSYDEIQALIARNRGKVVVLDAWSTSCEPCKKEFPHLVALHRRFAADQLACISLSFDFEGIGKPEAQLPRVEKFLREQQATFDNILSSDQSDELYKKFGLGSIPAVFVYDQSGALAKRFDNQKAKSKDEQFTYDDVTALVERLLRAVE